MNSSTAKILAISLAIAPFVALAQDQAPLEEQSGGGKWRLSVGYEWRPAMKAKFQFVPSLYNAGKATAVSAANKSQSAAGSAVAKGDYDDGYVHPDSGTAIDGDTTAWSAKDMSQYSAADETISFSSTYSVSQSSIKAPTAAAGEEKETLPGISVDLSRVILEKGDFSLGLALGFSYVFEKEIAAHTHSFALGSSSTSSRAIIDKYDVSYWAGIAPTSLNNQGNGESGAEIPATPASRTDVAVGGGSSATYNGGADFSVDFEMLELRLGIEPAYSPCDWFSVYGQLGVAVGQGKASWETSSWFSINGSRKTYSSSGDDKETFVQGYAGLGLRVMPFEHLGVSVFGDIRFGKGEVDVEADPYAGKIETGMFRAGAALTLAF